MLGLLELFLVVILVDDPILGRFLSEANHPLLSFSSTFVNFSVRRLRRLIITLSLLRPGELIEFL